MGGKGLKMIFLITAWEEKKSDSHNGTQTIWPIYLHSKISCHVILGQIVK